MKAAKLFSLFVSISLTAFSQTLPVDGKYQLVMLPYATDALEPFISKSTIELHHGKHLAGYVNNLNKLVVGTEFEGKSVEEIASKAPKGGIFNNAGQLLNHNLYFTQFSPNGKRTPEGSLAHAINKKWGSFDTFKAEFNKAGTSVFGSGWVWLSKDNDGKLHITTEKDGANPVASGLTPLLGFDVWEHAYYLDYQNRRADHLDALWNILDWNVVEKRY